MIGHCGCVDFGHERVSKTMCYWDTNITTRPGSYGKSKSGATAGPLVAAPDLAEPPVYAYHIQDVTYEGVPQYGTVIVKTADEAMLKFTAASASANRNVKQNTAAADND